MILFAPGDTSKSIDILVVDDSGLPVTGLVAATLPTVKYSLAGANADATITLSDLSTLTTAYSSGGVKERGEGVYRLDLPNAALASAGAVRVRGEATGKRVVCETVLVANVPANVTQLLGTAWLTPAVAGTPDVNAKQLGGTAQTGRDVGASVLLSSGTGAGQLSLSSGAVLLQPTQTGVTIPTVTNLTNAPTGGDFTTAMKTSLNAATPASVTGDVGGKVLGGGAGTITGTGVRAVDGGGNAIAPAGTALSTATWTGTLATNLGTTNATVATNLDTAVSSRSTLTQTQVTGGAYALNSASFAFNAALDFTTTQKAATLARVTLVDTVTTNTDMLTATAVWSAATRVLTAGTNIALAKGTGVTGFNDITAASVWDLATTGHTTGGTFGAAVNAAGSAGDPWSTSLPGGYTVGTAGYILGNRLDAAVSTRLATSGYTAPLDAAGTRTAVGLGSANLDTQLNGVSTGVTAVKAKTDHLPSSDIVHTLGRLWVLDGNGNPVAPASATTSLQAAVDALNDLSAAEVGDAVLDEVVDGPYTLRQLSRLFASALAGKLSGAATTAVAIRDLADTKARVTATVDADGNRTAVALDLA